FLIDGDGNRSVLTALDDDRVADDQRARRGAPGEVARAGELDDVGAPAGGAGLDVAADQLAGAAVGVDRVAVDAGGGSGAGVLAGPHAVGRRIAPEDLAAVGVEAGEDFLPLVQREKVDAAGLGDRTGVADADVGGPELWRA